MSIRIDNSDGWIKLHRKFTRWEWYTAPNMVQLFLHLLLMANHDDRRWRGVEIKRGQLVTSQENLANETGLTRQKIRTCLSHLEKTGEINQQTNHKLTKITICKYDEYQGDVGGANQLANQQPTNSQPSANHKQELKNNKNEKNKENLNKRKLKFEIELKDFAGKYPKDMLLDFWRYWTEPNKSGNKMRFEMQPTWDTGRRLITWHKRYKEKQPAQGRSIKSEKAPEGYGIPNPKAISRQDYLKQKQQTNGDNT